MPVRLTPLAREIMVQSREEARRFGHTAIDPEHLLLAFSANPKRKVFKVMRILGVSGEGFRATIETSLVPHKSRPKRNIKPKLSSRTRRVLEGALQEAYDLRQYYIGAGHILVSLLRNDHTTSKSLLHHAGISLDVAVDRIQALRSEW